MRVNRLCYKIILYLDPFTYYFHGSPLDASPPPRRSPPAMASSCRRCRCSRTACVLHQSSAIRVAARPSSLALARLAKKKKSIECFNFLARFARSLHLMITICDPTPRLVIGSCLRTNRPAHALGMRFASANRIPMRPVVYLM